MSPGLFLFLCLSLMAVAIFLDVAAHRRRRRLLRALATRWRMNYQPADALRVTPEVMPLFPVPGAANVRVMDLIYGLDGDRYRYVFSVEFTIGLVGPKRRVVRVASLSEPRERGGAGTVFLDLAPAQGTLIEQYHYLAPTGAPGGSSTSREAKSEREPA